MEAVEVQQRQGILIKQKFGDPVQPNPPEGVECLKGTTLPTSGDMQTAGVHVARPSLDSSLSLQKTQQQLQHPC